MAGVEYARSWLMAECSRLIPSNRIQSLVIRTLKRPFQSLFASSLVLLLASYGGASWYLWSKQRELIFFPARDVQKTPANVNLKYEEVWLATNESAVLNGWWLESDDPAAPTILYLHGNDSNIGGNLDHVARLRRMGFSVLVVDYRGYGKSSGGFPSESQMYEDAEMAWRYLRERHAAPGGVLVYGHSLGGAVAIDLAVHHPEAAGLIVESTFTSMREMAESTYWMFPLRLLLHEHFDALAKVPLLRLPTLFIHGSADAEVPYTMSERLFKAAGSAKWLTIIHGGGHENSPSVDEDLYRRALLDFAQESQRHR